LTAFRRIVLNAVPFNPVRPPEQRVSLMLSPPLSLNGRLFIESRDAADLREANVALVSVDPDLPSPRSVVTRSDGQFILNGVVPGSYVLETSNLPQDFYLKAARFGDDDVLEKPLTLETNDAVMPLQVLVGSDGGRLQVAAYSDTGERHPGAQLVLVPDAARRHRREQYRVATSGEDGRTIVGGIPPGSYKLFAWEYLEPYAYLNSNYMQAYEAFGVPVNITSGNNPPISAPLIRRD
jgi:hypothetical protein